MISRMLRLWGNGAVTLPKKWRDRFPTKNFLAEETDEGYLVIKPVVDVEFYENEDGWMGLHFPDGIDAKLLYSIMKEKIEKIENEEREQRRKRRSKSRKR